MQNWQVGVLACLALFAVLVLAAAVTAPRLRRRARVAAALPAPEESDEPGRPRAAVVVNPSKFADVDAVHDQIRAQFRQLGWAAPLWLETSVADPGTGQARAAVEAGAEVVCALGGDGTVRKVASELVGTGIPLGLLPAGTGNLLARNLELPLSSLPAAITVALTGQDRVIDVGRVRYLPQGDVPAGGNARDPATGHIREYFLVMSGLGFDASMIADAPEKLKAQIGYGAYVLSGLRHLYGARVGARLSINGGRPRRRRARTVLFANVGGLQAGITLMPTAIDDGQLDAMVLSPRAAVGWASVAAHVLTRHRRGSALIERFRFARLNLELSEPQQIQLDGDTAGLTQSAEVDVLPRALVVRTGAAPPANAGPGSAHGPDR